MLTRTAEYALRAVVVLARHDGAGPVAAAELAKQLGAPRNYLSKTLNALVHRGILTSIRGPGGGYALAVSPDVLSVADVTDLFTDARPADARCLLHERPCDPTRPCSAHRRWTELRLSARAPLLRTAIAELCVPHPPSKA